MPRAAALTKEAKLANAWSSVDKALAGTPWTSRDALPHKLPVGASEPMVKMLATAIRIAKGLDEHGVQQLDPPPSAVQVAERWTRFARDASRGSRCPKWTSTDLKMALAQARKDQRAGNVAPALAKTDEGLAGDIASLQTGFHSLQQAVAQLADSVRLLPDVVEARQDEARCNEARRKEYRASRASEFHFSPDVDRKVAMFEPQAAGPSK
ncbi:hypothetical protein JCM3775_000223 [Rhodotorula graminis]